MARDINIKYTDKDFNNLRGQLVELAKTYFPDSYNDFTPTSPGMMFMEMAAYVGDILSFYQDTQLQETYLQYAKNPSNLYTLAYMLGYRPKVTAAAQVQVEITQRVQATGADYLPDWDQAAQIEEGVVLSTGTQKFYIDNNIDFKVSSSVSPTDVAIYSISGDYPAEYLLTKKITASAGEIITRSISVGNLTPYFTFDIEDSDVIGILDIIDAQGNKYYEVPYLGQETVYSSTETSSPTAPYSLSVIQATRKFVSRFTSTGVLQVQFGPGSESTGNDIIVPNPDNIGSPTPTGVDRLDYAYDPSNFLYTDSYGISPANTTLTVRYLKGGGVSSNVEANTLTTATSVVSSATDNSYLGTIAFTNPTAATGGKDGDTVSELRQNTLRAFSEQGRLVTKEDFAFRALTMDPKFGVIAKTYVTTRESVTPANSEYSNPLSVCLYVLSYDANRNLVLAAHDIKQNLKTYLAPYLMLTDAVDIKDAFVINIGVKYDIISRPNYNSREILFNCTQELKRELNIDNRSINDPINLSKLYTVLDRVKGVQTVQNITVETKVGGNYSEYDYDIKGAIKNNIIYPSLDPMIFEVKYPDTDIQGRITTL